MSIYLVECIVPCGDNDKYIVKANSKKEALDKVWNEYYVYKNKKAEEKGYDLYYKKDLYVRNILVDFFKDNSSIEHI